MPGEAAFHSSRSDGFAGKRPCRAAHSAMRPRPSIGTRTENASAVNGRTAAAVTATTTCTPNAPRSSRVTSGGATPSPTKKSPLIVIVS